MRRDGSRGGAPSGGPGQQGRKAPSLKCYNCGGIGEVNLTRAEVERLQAEDPTLVAESGIRGRSPDCRAVFLQA